MLLFLLFFKGKIWIILQGFLSLGVMGNRVYIDNVGWCVRLVHYRLGEGEGIMESYVSYLLVG